MRRATLPMLAVLALSAGGCRNACQRLCNEMADYADECGLTYTEEDLKDCYASQSGGASRGDRAVCREFNDAESIRQEWSCEDLADYMSSDPGGGDTGDTGSAR